MLESLRILENNLKKFLAEAFGSSGSAHHNVRFRYNNLKLFVEPEIGAQPHFCINIGSTDACFSLETMTKIRGHIGADERFIIRWASRPGIKKMLGELWQEVVQNHVQEPQTTPQPEYEEAQPAQQAVQVNPPGKTRFKGFADLYRSIQ